MIPGPSGAADLPWKAPARACRFCRGCTSHARRGTRSPGSPWGPGRGREPEEQRRRRGHGQPQHCPGERRARSRADVSRLLRPGQQPRFSRATDGSGAGGRRRHPQPRCAGPEPRGLPGLRLGTRCGSARAGSRASRRTSTRLPREHLPEPSRGESAAQLQLTAEPAQPRAQTRFAPSARAAHGATWDRRLAEHKPLGLKLQSRAIYLGFWGCLCLSAYSGWVLTAMTETE